MVFDAAPSLRLFVAKNWSVSANLVSFCWSDSKFTKPIQFFTPHTPPVKTVLYAPKTTLPPKIYTCIISDKREGIHTAFDQKDLLSRSARPGAPIEWGIARAQEAPVAAMASHASPARKDLTEQDSLPGGRRPSSSIHANACAGANK